MGSDFRAEGLMVSGQHEISQNPGYNKDSRIRRLRSIFVYLGPTI